MKTITLNDNHIAHLNAKNTTKLEYLNLSNNNLLPTNDIDQLISSKHLWHVLVNGINNDPLAQMQYWTAVRNIIDDTNEVTIDLSGLNLTTQPPGLQNFTSINLDNNQLTHFDATNYDRLVKLSLNSNTLESINFPQGRNVSITHISMNNNALRNIDIDRLSSVTYFSAAHNQLEFVQLESCEWLQYLNLSHNQLTDIVAGNKNELLLLDLSHNKLTSLHNDLFPNLNTLLINNNLLSEIKIFYSNFCNVQTLNAANNQLKYINAAWIWVPLLAIATIAAWSGMNDIASSRASIADQLPVLQRLHLWLLSLLYLATFGSFIGFSAGFAMLAKTQFPDVNILRLAFFGPFIGAIARSVGGAISDKFGGVRVTLINFIFMAIFSALLFLTLPGTGSGNFIAFYAVFMGLFLTAGLGSGSTFQMIAVIFRQITIYRVKMKGGSDEQAQKEAVTETAAALGFISAIGAVGGFFIPQAFGMSLNMTGSPVGAMKVFLIFYIVCVLLTWLVYGRRKFSQK